MMPFAASLLVKVTAIVLLALGRHVARCGAGPRGRAPRAARGGVRGAARAADRLARRAGDLHRVAGRAVAARAPRAVDGTIGADETTQRPARRDAAAARPSRRSAPWPSWPTLVAGTWALGALLFLLPVIAGLSQVRALRRVGTAVAPRPGARRRARARDRRYARTVDVLLHESVPGPMTCGVISPVDRPARRRTAWEEEDLRRAIVHELEHVRRGDWASHCVARVRLRALLVPSAGLDRAAQPLARSGARL